jgi:gluconolactonase
MRRLVETDAHEGPVYVASERALYYTTARPQVEIRRLAIDSGEVTTVRARTGVANGMTLDHDGSLLVCEQEPAAITRVDRSGAVLETVVDAFRGRPLNSPNDIVVTRDGAIWFTDPSYAHIQGFGPEPQLPDAVYRYAGGDLTMVADGFEKPNGLAFSPDERVLYVGDSEACVLWAFEDGERRLFAEIAPGYPDGLKVDRAGRVYSTAGDGIHIFDPGGRRVGSIPIPGAVNFAFGDGALFITTDDAIWRTTT